jgi:hypothetical protein
MRYVYYSFSFLFGVEETLSCGVTGIAASIHITRKAPKTVQVNLTVDRVVVWDFVVDKVAPGQVSSKYLGFPCQIHSTNCSKKKNHLHHQSINHRGYVQ